MQGQVFIWSRLHERNLVPKIIAFMPYFQNILPEKHTKKEVLSDKKKLYY